MPTANVAVEISLDEHGELTGIGEERYQPPLGQQEIDRAIELARTHERLASRVVGLWAIAIPCAGLNNEWANRRVVEVLFGCHAARLPKYRAWVDLGTESLLDLSETCVCCTRNEA